MIAIRGATTIDTDTPVKIKEATVELMRELIAQNGLKPEKMISVLFTATKDICSAYPGKYLREELGITDVPILHFQEMDVQGALVLCIRVMIHYDASVPGTSVYLRKAKSLRPDLAGAAEDSQR